MLDHVKLTLVQLDLNLLTALDVLLEEESVTAAAERLYVSAPAMSRTLGRLRRATGDEVLVRTGRTMTPTPYALAVRQEVHDLVTRVTAVLAPHRELDLATLDRTFTLQLNDTITTAISPALVTAVHAEAPGVRVRQLAEGPTDTDDLRQGRVDLEVGSTRPERPEVRYETVAHDHFVVALRPQHPCASEDLTLERYAHSRHVTVSRRGRLRDPVDDALSNHGLHRRVIASAPNSTTALHMAAQDDLLVTGPRLMCRPTLDVLGLGTKPLPAGLDLTPIPVNIAWHQRYDNDPAHAWLREHVRAAIEAVLLAPGAEPAK
jgi:DNA-binding transcriptional LysR family regulator